MISKKFLYILVLPIFALSSCEKVIDVDLKDAAPRVVVEGQITNEAGLNLVKLTRTSSFYSNESAEIIDNAIVEVSDEFENKYILEEIAPGMYTNKTFAATSNRKYKLHVDIGTDIFESYSQTSSLVKIDSIRIEPNRFGPRNGEGDGSGEKYYKISCYFLDNADEVNFYRLRLIINGEYISGFYTIDDRFFNGNTITYNFNGIVLEDEDEVWIELLGVDEANYNYFYTLERLQSNNGQDITPGNPISNIEGGAIGVFGASTFDSFIEVFHVDK